MSEPTKQIGDGQDYFGQAAGQAAQAAKQISQEAAKQAANKGKEATANAAAATVQASVKTGKASAEIAAGTAAGGPWGAILSAAVAMRHTLFKILICICLFLLINRPIAVLFVRPSFECVAMTVDDYNRRVGPQNVISEKALHQAIEKECLMQNRDTQNSSEIIWQ